MTLAAHARVHGPLPRRSPAHQLIEEVERSGLRGRGGADFPTARKLRAVAERRRVGPVIVNGSETEPASAKDRLLLARLPHLVLDGAVLAAGAVGVASGDRQGRRERGRRGARRSRARSRRASRDPVSVAGRHAAPEGYVAGEESAVVHYLNGGAQLPRSSRRGRTSAATADARR